MRIRRHKAYDELARVAGREAGLEDPTPERVDEDPDARAIRDNYHAEYERRLRNTQTHSLDDVRLWLHGLGGKVGRSSIDRNRKVVIAKERAIVLSAQNARAMLEAVKEGGAEDLLAGGTALAGQRIFEALNHLPADALEGLSPGQTIKLFEVMGKLRKAEATASLADVQRDVIEQQRTKFDAETRRAQSASRDGKISPAQIDTIREALFGAK